MVVAYIVCQAIMPDKIERAKMFKPEYILDNVALFGLDDTYVLIAAKFQRMGKSRELAYRMARELVLSTVFVGE